MIDIYIGYDPKESAAYHVLAHSIIRRASVPVRITPLRQSLLVDEYSRAPDTRASTEFSLTRFLVPYLSNYTGVSIYMDCDMLMLGNVAALGHWSSSIFSVSCVKHDYTSRYQTKMQGQVQYEYPRKNWSSFMVFDNAACKTLTVPYVNEATPAELHRMDWVPGGGVHIGSLSLDWNHLVGEYEDRDAKDLKCLHWTLGGPWWNSYRNTAYADLWYAELDSLLHEVEPEDKHATTRLLQNVEAAAFRAGRLHTATCA